MYAQARASLKPAPRTQSNQDAPLQPGYSPSTSPSFDSTPTLTPNESYSRPNSVNGKRQSGSISPRVLQQPINTASTSTSNSSPRATPPSQTETIIRWAILNVNSSSVDLVKSFNSGAKNGSGSISRHQLAAVVDSDSRAAQQMIENVEGHAVMEANDGNDDVEGVRVFESLSSMFSSSFASPPTHLFISTSNDSTSNPNDLSTFQAASLALKSGLGVLVDRSAFLKPVSGNGVGGMSLVEAKELVSFAEGKQHSGAETKLTNGNGKGNEGSQGRFLGLLYNEVESGDFAPLLSSVATAYAKHGHESSDVRLSWQISLGFVKALDDLRSQFRQRSPNQNCSAKMKTDSSPSRKVPSSPRRSPRSLTQPFPSSASPKLNSGLGLLTEEISGTTSSGDLTVQEGSVDAQAALQAQVQELRQLLRHKNALISSLEQRANSASSVASTSSRRSSITAAQGHTSSPNLPRRRTSSLEPTRQASSPTVENPKTPGRTSKATTSSSSSNRPSSPSTSSSSGRRRSVEATRPLSPLGPPISSINQLGAVTESNSIGEGFLAPTIASENRRMANLGVNINGAASSGLNTTSIASSNPNSTGKVINNLTQSLSAAKEALDNTKGQLKTSQRNAATLQKAYDDLKEALARARLENESSTGMISRKDRQTAEAVERARKAEAESKELGRASREWGTRVREVEEELGELRRKNGKTEREYEIVASCWKSERGKMMEEVRKIREEVKRVRAEEIEEVKKLKEGLLEAQRKWRGLDVEKEKEGLGNLLSELEKNRERAVSVLGKEIEPLMSRMESNDKITQEQEKVVREVEGELRRIKTLMRRAEGKT